MRRLRISFDISMILRRDCGVRVELKVDEYSAYMVFRRLDEGVKNELVVAERIGLLNVGVGGLAVTVGPLNSGVDAVLALNISAKFAMRVSVLIVRDGCEPG